MTVLAETKASAPAHSSMQVMAMLSDLRKNADMSLFLALCSAVYLGVNTCCIVLNGFDMDDPDAVVSVEVFHRLEFWATFCFNVVQVVALMYMPKQFEELCSSPMFLKFVVLVNVWASFVAALLVTISVEEFEMPSHELEYTNELTMAVVDLLLLAALLRNMSGHLWERKNIGSYMSLLMVLLAVGIATTQLCIYNFLGWTEDGESEGETLAHYFEFAFESLSALIAFWFAMDNRFLAEARIESLLGLRKQDGPQGKGSEEQDASAAIEAHLCEERDASAAVDVSL